MYQLVDDYATDGRWWMSFKEKANTSYRKNERVWSFWTKW